MKILIRKLRSEQSIAAVYSLTLGTVFSYDDLGRPSGSTITSGSNAISYVDTYTLQGWLSKHTASSGINSYEETLHYDDTAEPSYCSLITAKDETI